MRKAVEEQLQIPYNEIKFERTEKGKPFLRNEIETALPNFSFNVSHQGQFAVLATEPEWQVGIDVMRVERPSTPSYLFIAHTNLIPRVTTMLKYRYFLNQ